MVAEYGWLDKRMLAKQKGKSTYTELNITKHKKRNKQNSRRFDLEFLFSFLFAHPQI